MMVSSRCQTGTSSPKQSPALEHHALYARHSTERTQAFLAKVYRGGRLLGLAPVIRMARFRATLLLQPEVRRRLDPWMGPFARKTTRLVDTSPLGFQYAAPFFALDPADFETVEGRWSRTCAPRGTPPR
jgi:hypothetical protein